MAELRSVLDSPFWYRLYQNLVGGDRSHRLFVRDYLRPYPGMRILDIGCGPADILKYLGDVEYHGFDMNPSYITAARTRHGSRAHFSCQRVDETTIGSLSGFDLVLAHGLLHHLDDADADRLFRVAGAALKSQGRLVTLDGVYLPGQPGFARFLIDRDRGRFVRTEQEYRRLASRHFSEVTTHIRHDMMHIPYTLIIMECTRIQAV